MLIFNIFKAESITPSILHQKKQRKKAKKQSMQSPMVLFSTPADLIFVPKANDYQMANQLFIDILFRVFLGSVAKAMLLMFI